MQRLQTNEHSSLDALKDDKQQISYKEGTWKIKSKKQSTSKVYRTQGVTKNVCVMNLNVKTCEVKCGWDISAS